MKPLAIPVKGGQRLFARVLPEWAHAYQPVDMCEVTAFIPRNGLVHAKDVHGWEALFLPSEIRIGTAEDWAKYDAREKAR